MNRRRKPSRPLLLFESEPKTLHRFLKSAQFRSLEKELAHYQPEISVALLEALAYTVAQQPLLATIDHPPGAVESTKQFLKIVRFAENLNRGISSLHMQNREELERNTSLNLTSLARELEELKDSAEILRSANNNYQRSKRKRAESGKWLANEICILIDTANNASGTNLTAQGRAEQVHRLMSACGLSPASLRRLMRTLPRPMSFRRTLTTSEAVSVIRSTSTADRDFGNLRLESYDDRFVGLLK